MNLCNIQAYDLPTQTCNSIGNAVSVIHIKKASRYLIKKYGAYKAMQIMIDRYINNVNQNQRGFIK